MAGKDKGRGGGGGGFLPSWLSGIIKVLLVFGVMFAIFQIPSGGTSLASMFNTATNAAGQIANWIKGVSNSIANGSPDLGLDINTPNPVEIDLNDPNIKLDSENFTIDNLLAALQSAPTEFNPDAPYDRYDWRHWDNITSCWTVREEVLWRDAKKDESLTILDKNDVRTNNKEEACEITGGTWVDPYTGETFTNPSDLDIDHMIALGYAARAGGDKWDSDKKMDYANSLTYEFHLIAVSASANRSKSDNGPSEWIPKREAFHCQYGVAWTVVSNQWGLSLAQADKDAIQSLLKKCKD
jgi:hypothetical protein